MSIKFNYLISMFVLMNVFMILFISNEAFSQQFKGKSIKSGVWDSRVIEYLDQRIILKLEQGKSIIDIEDILQKYECKIVRELGSKEILLLEAPSSSDLLKVISNLGESPFIEFVEPDIVGYIHITEPNDPDYDPMQWSLYNYGQNPPDGIPGVDIEMRKAWDITTGSSEILVAVFCTGIPLTPDGDLIHPELDDENRYILGPDFDIGAFGVKDENGHGTAVLGVIAAETNNDTGIAGIDWNCKVLVIQVLNEYGITSASAFKDGVDSAIVAEADVIHMSAGLGKSNWVETAVYKADSAGIVQVYSAGNSGGKYGVGYPARYAFTGDKPGHSNGYEGVIAVAATDHEDSRASYSSYNPSGININVAAPGGAGENRPNMSDKDIYTTMPNYSVHINQQYDYTQNYAYLSGTSFAAPQVTGIANLIRGISPSISAEEIRIIIEESAEDINYDIYPGEDKYLGHGRVNAYKALIYTLENYGGTIGGEGKIITFHENITIEPGVTLTIRPGTTVKIYDGKKLKIEGSLMAEGESSSPITFCSSNTSPSPGDWYGIEVYGSGATASLEHCIIKDASRGVRLYYSATGDISNCEIKDNQYGIYAYKSNFDVEDCTIKNNTIRGIYISRANDVAGSTSIIDNLIENNNYAGIRLYKSSVGVVRYNEIFDHNIGIDCSKSSPRLGYHGIKGWNNFNDNSTHFWAEYDCNPFLGNDICIDGYNQFTNLGNYNVWAESDCYILAKANYWDDYGASRFSEHDGSTIVRSDPLPGPIFQLSKLAALTDESDFDETFSLVQDSLDIDRLINEVYDPTWSGDRKFEFAMALNNLNFTAEAKTICVDIINSDTDEKYKIPALNLLNEIYTGFLVTGNNIIEEFKTFCTTNRKILNSLKLRNLASLMITEIISPLDMDEIDKLIAENQKNSIGARALQVKFIHYLDEENDLEKTARVYEEISKLYPGSKLEESAAIELYGSADRSFKKNSRENLNQVPEQFKLNGAYPNPFNPETKIMYSLPAEANVKIEIYNIIGQRVSVFEFDGMMPGNHHVIWYGRNEQNVQMPSGVYIIRFIADPTDKSFDIFKASTKVTLLK